MKKYKITMYINGRKYITECSKEGREYIKESFAKGKRIGNDGLEDGSSNIFNGYDLKKCEHIEIVPIKGGKSK